MHFPVEWYYTLFFQSCVIPVIRVRGQNVFHLSNKVFHILNKKVLNYSGVGANPNTISLLSMKSLNEVVFWFNGVIIRNHI
jgi:hypothetical protein